MKDGFFKLPTKKKCLKKCMSTVVFCETTHSHYGGEQKIAAFAITPTESRSPRLPPRLIPGASTGGAKMEAAAVLSMAWRPVVRNAGDFIIPMRLVSSSNEATDLFLAQMDPKTQMDLFIFIRINRIGFRIQNGCTVNHRFFCPAWSIDIVFKFNFRWLIFMSQIQKNWRLVSF